MVFSVCPTYKGPGVLVRVAMVERNLDVGWGVQDNVRHRLGCRGEG
jgi:hypothetical protein